MITFAAIIPHSKELIPAIGNAPELRQTQITQQSLKEIADLFSKRNIDIVIVISTHGPIEYQEITINSAPELYGNFEQYGDFKTHFHFKNDLEFVDLLKEFSKNQNVVTRVLDNAFLDHGCLVPCYFLFGDNVPENLKVIPTYTSFPDAQTNFNFGKTIFEVCEKSNKNIAVVASANLSHRLNLSSSRGFAPEGPEFDRQIISGLETNNFNSILNMEPEIIKDAGECGYLSIAMLLGTISEINRKRIFKRDVQFKNLSYEGSSGVGHLTGYYLF